ncbi:uncharacterized protein GBIM_02119 [Gryllus bimaculatus]|nr:uncharacterized protein GBIM_02119 [Gryllus bimaculatus]
MMIGQFEMPNGEHNYSPKVADEAQDDTSASSSSTTPAPPPVTPPLPDPAPDPFPGPFPEPDPEEARVPVATASGAPPARANTDGNALPASHLPPTNTSLSSGREDHEKEKLDKPGVSENGRLIVSDTKGKSGKLKIVERIVQLPIMKCTVNVYEVLKTNNLTGWSVYLAETTAKLTLAPAMYMASALASVCNLPVRCVDATLCLGLDVVEAAFPCMKVNPNQMYATTRTYVAGCVCCCPRAVSSAVSKIYQHSTEDVF